MRDDKRAHPMSTTAYIVALIALSCCITQSDAGK